MRRWLGVAVLTLILPMGGALAQATFDGLWKEATERPGCSPQDYPDLTLVICDKALTVWYFTKANHPAHPGVIKRTITQQPDGAWVVREEGNSFGPDSSQPAFKAWLAQIVDLDQQMRQAIQEDHAKPN